MKSTFRDGVGWSFRESDVFVCRWRDRSGSDFALLSFFARCTREKKWSSSSDVTNTTKFSEKKNMEDREGGGVSVYPSNGWVQPPIWR